MDENSDIFNMVDERGEKQFMSLTFCFCRSKLPVFVIVLLHCLASFFIKFEMVYYNNLTMRYAYVFSACVSRFVVI